MLVSTVLTLALIAQAPMIRLHDHRRNGIVASPERQRELMEEVHRRVASPEIQERMKADRDSQIKRNQSRLTFETNSKAIEAEPEPQSKGTEYYKRGVGLLLCAFFFASFIIYLLPMMIAYQRNHHNACAIMILNLCLGWTFIGWVLALVWSATKVQVETPMAKARGCSDWT